MEMNKKYKCYFFKDINLSYYFCFFVSNYCENIFENRKDLQFTVSLFIGVVPPGFEPATP